MNLELEGKVAVVAAASKGLGYGIARALAGEGAKVSICSRDLDSAQLAAEKIASETGADTLGVACDVSKLEQITSWIDRTVDHFGNIDMLVTNAGGPPALVLHEATEEQWFAAFELTTMSTVRIIRAALPYINNGGAILTVTSSSTKEPINGLGLSTVMRAGIVGMVKVYADELAPRGIRVNNLVPGRILTDRIVHLDSVNAQRTGESPEAIRVKSESAIPLQRLGTIEEFGRAAAFLLSPAASYTTGATLRVDGGAMRSIDF
jgi:3-oxoacyl-[acyl-carrier protein] reductase